MVMFQKQSKNRRSEKVPTFTKSKKATAGPEFNKEHVPFLDAKGTAQRECVPLNTIINSDSYCDVLRRFRENLRRKSPELWRNHNWLLHHETSLKTPVCD
jgi:hypothetical protein